MFDEDDRRLVQVASVVNAIGAAENVPPWRVLLWLAGEVEAGTLVASLYIPLRMRTVETTRASPKESIDVWRSMARRVQAACMDGRLKLDQRDSFLPSAASTWHVHVNDLLRFVETAAMTGASRAELLELAQRYRGSDPATAQAMPAQDSAILAKLVAETDESSSASAKRWTPDLLAELAEHQATHGATAASAHFEISVSRVNQLLRKHRAECESAAPPTPHVPFPPRKGLR